MAMIVGDAASNTGLAGAVYTAMLAADPQLASDVVAHPTLATKIQRMANGIAGGIVPYVQANAVVSTTIGTTSPAFDGLQTSQAAGSPTTAPGVAKTLTGSVA